MKRQVSMQKTVTRYIIACLLLALVSTCTVGGTAVSAKLSKKAQIKKYQSAIRKYDMKLRSAAGESASDFNTYYAYVDIDKNGIYELILRYDRKGGKHTTISGSYYGDTTTIYTLKKNKVKRVRYRGQFDTAVHTGTLRIYKNKNMLEDDFGSSAVPVSYYRYKEGKISQKGISLSYVPASASVTGKAFYMIGDRTVSKKEYNKKQKELIGNAKGYKMKKWK